MEVFKSRSALASVLWPPAGLNASLQAEHSGGIAQVTQLDNYYQFILQGTGEERLERLLDKWSTGGNPNERGFSPQDR